jgi:predicted nucleic acid-binding protein
MRAVIDTNVWVSAVLNPHGAPARCSKPSVKHGFSQYKVSHLWTNCAR